jgi:hypothetical protein
MPTKLEILKWGIDGRLKRFSFDRAARGILKTAPLEINPDGPLMITLLSHRDMIMYLISAKSFYHYFGKGEFMVISDGSLTRKDENILRYHFPGIKIISIDSIENPFCPKKGCWERLLCVAENNEDRYVIVLDADMITQNPVDDIVRFADNNQSFIMGATPTENVSTMPEILAEEREKYKGINMDEEHIQHIFDTNLDKISGYESLKYLKGSGGFNGFSKGSITRKDVESFSTEMENLFSKKWHGWGSEQIAVCYLIANTPNSVILPRPEYIIFYNEKDISYEDSSLVHFVGMCRFNAGFYAQQAEKFVRSIK